MVLKTERRVFCQSPELSKVGKDGVLLFLSIILLDCIQNFHIILFVFIKK